MAHTWFIVREETEEGPFTSNELKLKAAKGSLSPDGLVRRADMQAPITASSIKGLFAQSETAPTPGIPQVILVASTSNMVGTDSPPPLRKVGGNKLWEKWQRLRPSMKLGIGVGGSFLILILCCGGIGLIIKAGRGSTNNKAVDLSAAKGKGVRGYLDTNGKLAVDFHFDHGFEFSDGLAAVQVKGKWGYIDKSGKHVIGPKYDSAGNFSEGLAGVTLNGNSLCIDRAGNVVFECQYTLTPFSNGVAPVYLKAPTPQSPYRLLYGLVDTKGTVVVTPRFSQMSPFADGRAIVQLGDGDEEQHGIIDKTGRFVVEPTSRFRFGHFGSPSKMGFSQGLVAYTDKSLLLAGYVDVDGKQVIPAAVARCEPTFAGRFSEGLGRIQRGAGQRAINGDEEMPPDYMKVGYVDRSGAAAIPPQFANGKDFSEGLAAVQPQKGGKWGYIDRKGKMVIEPQFDEAGDFADGRAVVKVKDGVGVIDPQGHYVVPAKYAYIGRYSEGLATIER